MLTLLPSYAHLSRASIYYSILGELYLDPFNPYREVNLAKRLFDKAKSSSNVDLKSLSMLAQQGLSKTYAELAKDEMQRAKDTELSYAEGTAVDALRELPDTTKRQVGAYAQMGDVYSEKLNPLVATALYANGLGMAEKRDVVDFDAQLWEKLGKLEREYYPQLREGDVPYREQIMSYRSALENMRGHASRKLHTQPIEEVYAYIAAQYKLLIGDMVAQLQEQLGPPPANFAIVGYGSLGRQMATPYSDVELAMLIDPSCKGADREYFSHLFYLLTMRLTAIGETPIAYMKLSSLAWMEVEDGPSVRGFMLDPALIAPRKYCIGTPQEIAQHAFSKSSSDRPELQLSLLNYTWVAGSHELISHYQHALEEAFDAPLRHSLFLELLLRDLARFELKLQNGAEFSRYSVKHDLYRPLSTIIEALALKYLPRQSASMWELIRQLQAAAILDSTQAKSLSEMLDQIALLRLEVYLKAGEQSEWIATDLQDMESPFYHIEHKDLQGILGVIADWQGKARYAMLNTWMDFSYDPSTPFRESADNAIAEGSISLENKGLIYLSQLQFDLAKSSLETALHRAPQSKQAWRYLGNLALSMESYAEAIVCFEKLLALADSAIEQAQALHGLGLAHLYAERPAEAAPFFSRALALYRQSHTPYAESHAFLSPDYIGLGLSQVMLGNVESGLAAMLKRVEIDQRFYGASHPEVSNDYYLLGKALQIAGHQHEASAHFEKALKNDAFIYGSHHLRLSPYCRGLATSALQLNDPIKAQQYFRRALEIDVCVLGPHHPRVVSDRELLRMASSLPYMPEEQPNASLEGLHGNCMEERLARAYRASHPLYKAKRLHELGKKTLAKGQRAKAQKYFDQAELVEASYYQQPL